MTIQYVSPAEISTVVRARLRPMGTVLDMGSAYGPQAWVPYNQCYCIEPNPFFFELMTRDYVRDPRCRLLSGTWQDHVSHFAPGTFDAVTAFDSIEHMDKADGLLFLEQAKAIARQQVLVSTPLGFYPQNYDDPSLTINGVPYLHWETHLSGWTPQDFGEGWDFVIAEGAYSNDGNGNALDKPIGLLWAFWEKP